MAPLTRSRVDKNGIPGPLVARYYVQRASAGLIITEATCISPQAVGYPYTPGIFTADQIDAWRFVTDAVHAASGRMYMQLWHVGRVSHPSLQPGGGLPVAPSPIAPAGRAQTYRGRRDYVTPHALTKSEIRAIVSDYGQAAANARDAGFDGIELHAANGYLIDQFLRDSANARQDEYGGSVKNRTRLLFEILDAVNGVFDLDRVGIRISPTSTYKNMGDSDPQALYAFLASELDRCRPVYLHCVEPRPDYDGPRVDARFIRTHFGGTILSVGGHSRQSAMEFVRRGYADFIAFGKLFISNPDLPRRLELDADLNDYDPYTFYYGGSKGYTDYPKLEEGTRRIKHSMVKRLTNRLYRELSKYLPLPPR